MKKNKKNEEVRIEINDYIEEKEQGENGKKVYSCMVFVLICCVLSYFCIVFVWKMNNLFMDLFYMVIISVTIW